MQKWTDSCRWLNPIITGFQGITDTTLGRGGSDTTVLQLLLLKLRCDIYTDVDGIYTTDPRIVPNAKKLDAISMEGCSSLRTRS